MTAPNSVTLPQTSSAEYAATLVTWLATVLTDSVEPIGVMMTKVDLGHVQLLKSVEGMLSIESTNRSCRNYQEGHLSATERHHHASKPVREDTTMEMDIVAANLSNPGSVDRLEGLLHGSNAAVMILMVPHLPVLGQAAADEVESLMEDEVEIPMAATIRTKGTTTPVHLLAVRHLGNKPRLHPDRTMAITADIQAVTIKMLMVTAKA